MSCLQRLLLSTQKPVHKDMEQRQLSELFLQASQSRVCANSPSTEHHQSLSLSSSPSLFPPTPPTLGRRGLQKIEDDSTHLVPLPARRSILKELPNPLEIWSLPLDQRDNAEVVENAETSLHPSGEENSKLSKTFAAIEQENVSLKRQVHYLQVESRSALDKVTVERDRVQKDLGTLRHRLEQFQGDTYRYEEDANRLQYLDDPHRRAWDAARRRFEVKVHLAELLLESASNEVATSSPPDTRTSRCDSPISEIQFKPHTDCNCDVVASHGGYMERSTVKLPLHLEGQWRSLAKEPALDKEHRFPTDNTTVELQHDFVENLLEHQTQPFSLDMRWSVKLSKLSDPSLDSDREDGDTSILQGVAKPRGGTPLVSGGPPAIRETSLQSVESTVSSLPESPNSAFREQHQNNDDNFLNVHYSTDEVETREDFCLFTAYDESSDDEFHIPSAVARESVSGNLSTRKLVY